VLREPRTLSFKDSQEPSLSQSLLFEQLRCLHTQRLGDPVKRLQCNIASPSVLDITPFGSTPELCPGCRLVQRPSSINPQPFNFVGVQRHPYSLVHDGSSHDPVVADRSGTLHPYNVPIRVNIVHEHGVPILVNNRTASMRTYETQLARRHFEIVADAVRAAAMPVEVRRQVTRQLADRLSQTNPRFNRWRFCRACGCETD
jgi:hypothetical protein